MRSHAIIEALPQIGCRSSATPDPKIKGDDRSQLMRFVVGGLLGPEVTHRVGVGPVLGE